MLAATNREHYGSRSYRFAKTFRELSVVSVSNVAAVMREDEKLRREAGCAPFEIRESNVIDVACKKSARRVGVNDADDRRKRVR